MAFNEEQLKGINSNSRTILCLAGAGSGKTTVMINRVFRLVSDGVNPRNILSLTFTNAAGFEMSQRYKKLSGGDPNQPEFRTFHSFAYSLLIKDPNVRNELGYTKVPEVCDDNMLKKVKTYVRLQTKVGLSQDQLDSDGASLSMKEKREYDIYHKALSNELKTRNLVTFDILNNDVSYLFSSNNPLTDKYKQKYTYINVDEFQDTDDAQMRFLNSFPETTNFFCVGDALQNIYAFRGCTNKYVKLLSENKDWEKITLFNNYRSTNQICEYANNFTKSYASPSYRISMKGQRDGDDVEIYYGSCAEFDSPVSYNHVLKLIDKLIDNDEECAILCRTNREVQYICEQLRLVEIEFATSNKSTDDKDILQSVLDNEYMLNWLSTFLDVDKYAEYIRLSSQLDCPDLRWFLSKYGGNDKIKPRANKVIEIRKILASSLDIDEKFTKIVKILKTKIKDCDLSGISDSSALTQFLIDTVTTVEDHKIYVGTIHSSKGLEYDHVYLMDVGDKPFPLDSEENKNLFYVGCTRAKNKLTIFRA